MIRKRTLGTAALTLFLSSGIIAYCDPQLPDGEGKEVTERACSECHGLDTVVAERHTKEGWQTVVDSMIDRGASVKDTEVKVIVNYLAKYFGSKEKDSTSK